MSNLTSEERWAARVAEWRASGLTSTEYCEGRGFSAGCLRHWAHLLKRRGITVGDGATSASKAVRLVRVERSGVVAQPSTVAPPAPVTIELGDARVTVPSGFDAATLRTVIESLTAQHTTRGSR